MAGPLRPPCRRKKLRPLRPRLTARTPLCSVPSSSPRKIFDFAGAPVFFQKKKRKRSKAAVFGGPFLGLHQPFLFRRPHIECVNPPPVSGGVFLGTMPSKPGLSPLFCYHFVTLFHFLPESFPVNSCPIGSKVGIIIQLQPKSLDKSGAQVYTERSFPLVTKVTSRPFKTGGRPILPCGGQHGAPSFPPRARHGAGAFQGPAVKSPY